MKICLLSAILLTAAVPQAKILWLENDYDFGLIHETDGKASGRVRFVNTGKEPVAVTGARAACGCTGVEYPHDPIAPGDTAVISFSYNPAGRPGPFEKSIRVYFGDSDASRIMIRGTVLGTRESLEPIYPFEAGAMRLSSTALPPLDMKYGETRHLFINVYNQSSDTIVPEVKGATKALDARLSSPSVAPGELMTVAFYYNSRLQPEVGPIEIPLEIVSDTRIPGAPVVPMTFRANVKPDYSSLGTEDIKEAPSCYVSPQSVDLGIVAGDKTRAFSFGLLNEGKSQLDVLRIVTPPAEDSAGTLKVRSYPTRLKPGKSGTVQGTFSPGAMKPGAFRLEIEVLTNDPLHPSRTVRVVGIRE